ncbi:MAG TPA: glucose 1-dehydrogenase [Terriglobia bacterium]|nr:glucose 1-dehydrogenase [Terriglobia bacterium]
MRLKNKVAIVTGGAAGIGRAIAHRYAREGALVTIADLNRGVGEANAEEIQKSGAQAMFVETDVSSEEQVKAMVEETIARFGRVDILVNNAAVLMTQGEARAHELSNEVWEHTINVNLRGYWLCSKHVIPSMLHNGGGCIILVASRTGLQGFTRLTAYSASKGGVLGLMRAMAVDYAPDRIRVNAIVPGTTDTPMNAEALSAPGVREERAGRIPAGRLGLPGDISGMAVFLASEDAEYCLGGVYMVDGGATLT